MERTIDHYEIPAQNPEALVKFYTSLFGWSMEKWEGPLEYWTVQTTKDKTGASLGFYKKEKPEDVLLNYIRVESVEEFAKKAETLGGKLLVPKGPIPGTGYFAVIQDLEGNPLGLFESDPSAK